MLRLDIDDNAAMEWILVLMVVIPALAFGGVAAYAATGALRERRLLGGSPTAARLRLRARRALEGLEESCRQRQLPASTSREVLAHATELANRTLPELLERHGRLESRVRDYGPGGDSERQRAMQQLATELAATERTLESLVGGLETLDAQLVASATLPGDEALARTRLLVEQLRLIEESCRELEEEKKCLEP